MKLGGRIWGLLVFLFGIAVILYLGVYLGLYGGIGLSVVDLINQCKATTTDAHSVCVDLLFLVMGFFFACFCMWAGSVAIAAGVTFMIYGTLQSAREKAMEMASLNLVNHQLVGAST